MTRLQRILREQGQSISRDLIGAIIEDPGFKCEKRASCTRAVAAIIASSDSSFWFSIDYASPLLETWSVHRKYLIRGRWLISPGFYFCGPRILTPGPLNARF